MDSLVKEKGADWVRVPFKGGGEAYTAILSGTTPIGLIGLGNVKSQIDTRQDDQVLALTNNIRTPQLPKTPTFADIGYKGCAVADLVRAVLHLPARRRRSSTNSTLKSCS